MNLTTMAAMNIKIDIKKKKKNLHPFKNKIMNNKTRIVKENTE